MCALLAQCAAGSFHLACEGIEHMTWSGSAIAHFTHCTLVQVGGSTGMCAKDAAETGGTVLPAGGGVCTPLLTLHTVYSCNVYITDCIASGLQYCTVKLVLLHNLSCLYDSLTHVVCFSSALDLFLQLYNSVIFRVHAYITFSLLQVHVCAFEVP